MSLRPTRRPHADCEQFQDRLQDVLDERRDPTADSELNSHASQCGRCARLLSLQTSLWNCVHAWAAQSSDGDQTEATAGGKYETCSEVTPARTDREWQVSGWTGALALASMLLVSGTMLWFGSDGSRQNGGSARSAAGYSTARMAEQFPQRGAAARPHGVLAAGMVDKSRGRAGNAEHGPSSGRLPHMGPVGIESWLAQFSLLNETAAALPLERISEVPEMAGVQDLTDGMRPAAQSVESVIQVLWGSVPSPKPDHREFRMPDTSSRIVRTCVC